jgi:transcriptional regulator with XRE-family HTH domain
MTGAELRQWRARLELSQLEAADRLGLDERHFRRLEAADRIKRTIALACAALAAGLAPYGEDPAGGRGPAAARKTANAGISEGEGK